MAKCLKESLSMASGPVLIFDKSSLESLNLDEAVLLDNFYRSNSTPLFFVECLADLEKSIRSKSTPEQRWSGPPRDPDLPSIERKIQSADDYRRNR